MRRALPSVVTLALVGLSSAAYAVLQVPPLTAGGLRCDQRVVAGGRTSDGAVVASALLESAMRGKKFTMSAQASLLAFDQRLVRYGLQTPLAALSPGAEREAVTRVAQLVENGYVVAAQMALGAARRSGVLSPHIQMIVGNMVGTATEASEADPDLAKIGSMLVQAKESVAAMPELQRGFATWSVQGYAFDDPIAVDAALAGFCLTDPAPSAVQQLVEATQRVYLGPLAAGSAKPRASAAPHRH